MSDDDLRRLLGGRLRRLRNAMAHRIANFALNRIASRDYRDDDLCARIVWEHRDGEAA